MTTAEKTAQREDLREAWAEGDLAALLGGYAQDANPYPPESQLHWAWDRGLAGHPLPRWSR